MHWSDDGSGIDDVPPVRLRRRSAAAATHHPQRVLFGDGSVRLVGRQREHERDRQEDKQRSPTRTKQQRVPPRLQSASVATLPIGDPTTPPVPAPPPPPPSIVHDVFCRGGVHLCVVNGFAHEGKLFAFQRQANVAAPSTSRAYDNLSLHFESLPDSETVATLSLYHNSANRTQLTLLATILMKQVVRVSKGSDRDDELWLDVLEEGPPSNTAAVHRGAPTPPRPTVVTMRINASTTLVRNKLHASIQEAIARCNSSRRAEVSANAVSSAALARDTLHSLRMLQKRTSRMLDDLRSEFVSDAIPGSMLEDNDAATEPQESWAERTIVRRQHLGEAQMTLRDIQSRRQQRADRVARLVGGAQDFAIEDVVVASPPLGERIGSMRLESRRMSSPADQQPQLTRRRSVASAMQLKSPPQQDEGLCKHCGEPLPTRSDLRAHQSICAYRPVKCRKCSALVKAKDFKKHRDIKCPGRGRASLKRRNSNLSEVSSSSMEELDNDSLGSSNRSPTPSTRRKPSHLQELPRSESGRWQDVSQTTRRQSSRRPSALSPEALRELQLSSSSFEPSPLRRTQSTLERVETRCVYCGRRAPSSHTARCAHRPVVCGVCGKEMKAKEASKHADTHR